MRRSNDIRRLFNIYGSRYDGMNYAGNVYDIHGISPSLTTMNGGGTQPMIMTCYETE